MTLDHRIRQDFLALFGILWAVRYILALALVLVVWVGVSFFAIFNEYSPGPPPAPRP